ncbi:hypothetical protein Tco_0912561, partial [Tanacetum coccineum]
QKFEDLPLEHDILSFIRDLGHSGDIIYLSDVSVDYLHQPWRAFATIINKFLSGKETGMDKIRTRLKTKAKVAKSVKKKQPAKMPKAKGLDVLSKVALTEAEQLKLATKRSKTQFHRSHASGLGDGVDSQLKVHDEQHLKTIGADEGTGTIPGVPNVPKYDFESDKQSWGDSKENDDDDDGNDDHDDDKEDVDERVHTPSNYELTDDEMIHDEEKIDDEEMMDEEEEDESGFEQVEEDAHVTLTLVLDTQKADEPVQSSSVSSDFTSKLLNLENPSPANNEIDSLMKTSSYHVQRQIDHYIDNKLGEAIKKAIQAHNLDYRQEAQDEKNAYIELVDTLIRAMIKEESTYEAAASLTEFELIEILLDKIEESKSHLIVDHKKKFYDALVESYNTDKDLFDSYGEVFKLKRSRDDRDQDRDPSTRSNRGIKRRKSKEPGHTVYDSGVQQDQEFDMGNNDKQPADKEVTKDDWFKKPERPLAPDSDWNKRQHLDSRPPQTWISQVAHAKEPHTSFDELMNTSFDFSTFFLNRLNIKDLTQEILVGLAFELLKGKPYPFDLSKPLPLIRDHQGCQVIPKDFFINNDLEYLKGGDLSRRYSSSVMKTKAATYEIKWNEDLV